MYYYMQHDTSIEQNIQKHKWKEAELIGEYLLESPSHGTTSRVFRGWLIKVVYMASEECIQIFQYFGDNPADSYVETQNNRRPTQSCLMITDNNLHYIKTPRTCESHSGMFKPRQSVII